MIRSPCAHPALVALQSGTYGSPSLLDAHTREKILSDRVHSAAATDRHRLRVSRVPFTRTECIMKYSRLAIAAAAAAISLAAQASSHREAPFIAQHPSVDGTDFYMFRSYE